MYSIHSVSYTITFPKVVFIGSNFNSIESFLLNEQKYELKRFCLTNFSEMVAEKNVAKGKNWKEIATINNPNATCHYSKPTDWLTFRCVCEVED